MVDLIKDSEEKTENKKLLAAVTGHYEAKILMKLHFDFIRYLLSELVQARPKSF